MRAQKAAALEIERVVHVHRGMIRRKVQRAEVVPLVLDLGARRDREAQVAEDSLDFLEDDGDGMLSAAPLAARGHREIERGCRGRGGGECGVARVDRGLELDLHGVETRAEGGLVGAGELRKLRLVIVERAARAPNRRRAHRLERVERVGDG